MSYQHPDLASGKWKKLSFVEQMANIGSEVERSINWKVKNNPNYSQMAFERALELIDLTVTMPQSPSRLRELTRLREVFVEYFLGPNHYGSSDQLRRNYFYPFTYAARIQKDHFSS